MCELAIVIRFSVYHIKKKANLRDSELTLDDSLTEPKQSNLFRNYTIIVRSTFVLCSAGALASAVCCIYLWVWIEDHGRAPTYDFFAMVKLFSDDGVDVYWRINKHSSTWLLSILSVGLAIAFTILVYNIKTYYREKMHREMMWLSILFAVFLVSYGARTIYQYFLGSFRDYVPDMITRWHFVNTLPLIFDILSIGAILVMHHLNFRKPHRGEGHPYYAERSYDIMPEDVEDLEYTTPYSEHSDDEDDLAKPLRRQSSTLNSSDGKVLSHKRSDQLKTMNYIEQEESKLMTTRISNKKSFNHTRQSCESERFDLDTNIMSEIEKNKKRLKNQKLRREAHRQRRKRSGLAIASDTSSKTSNSHLLPGDYDRRDITPAMSSVSEEEEGNKFTPRTD